jgi:hypothetical protein
MATFEVCGFRIEMEDTTEEEYTTKRVDCRVKK